MKYCKQTHTYSLLAKIKKTILALKFKYIYIILLKLSVKFLLISVVMLVSMATTLLLSAYHKDYLLFAKENPFTTRDNQLIITEYCLHAHV